MGFAVRVRSAGQKYGPTCHQTDRADVTEFVTLVRLSSLGQHVGVLALAGYKRRKSALTAGPILGSCLAIPIFLRSLVSPPRFKACMQAVPKGHVLLSSILNKSRSATGQIVPSCMVKCAQKGVGLCSTFTLLGTRTMCYGLQHIVLSTLHAHHKTQQLLQIER